MDPKVIVLKGVYLFEDCTDQELQDLADIATMENIIAGESIFSDGDDSHSMYFIQTGSVNIYKTNKEGDDIAIATLSSNSHFGEIPFLDGEKRSTSVKTEETSSLVVLPYNMLWKLLAKNSILELKLYKAFCKFLCRRLRHGNEDLTALKTRNSKQ